MTDKTRPEKPIVEGTWDPTIEQQKSNFTIDRQRLQQYIELSRNNLLDQLDQQLSNDDKQSQAPLMQQSRADWMSVGESFSDDDIIHLMRFFTLAEQLPGWESGDNSPVIALGKVLKKRAVGINKELLIWIKANSRNQFLPHGSLV